MKTWTLVFVLYTWGQTLEPTTIPNLYSEQACHSLAEMIDELSDKPQSGVKEHLCLAVPPILRSE